jgi:hypothetical protein
MAIAAGATDLPVAWWKEPTKDQWLAWIAAWLGWTLDAFDFTTRQFSAMLVLLSGSASSLLFKPRRHWSASR